MPTLVQVESNGWPRRRCRARIILTCSKSSSGRSSTASRIRRSLFQTHHVNRDGVDLEVGFQPLMAREAQRLSLDD